jgi:hypothetical protein
VRRADWSSLHSAARPVAAIETIVRVKWILFHGHGQRAAGYRPRGLQTRIRAWLHLTAESITKRLSRTISRTYAQRLHTRRPSAEAVITTETCVNHSMA